MTREHAIAEREAFNAFCDGKEIEQRSRLVPQDWRPCPKTPIFGEDYEHRVKSTPRMMDLGPEDVPPGSVLQGPNWKNGWRAILEVNSTVLYAGPIGHGETVTQKITYVDLREKGYLISRDNGRTWQRAEKEEKV